MNGVLIPVQKEFSLSDAQVGQLNTAFMLSYFITAPFFGYLGDRSHRKILIALGVAVAGAASLMTGWAASFTQLLAARVLIGVGEASYASIGPSLIADAFPHAKRNWALTIFYTALPLGAALGFLLGGQIAAAYDWRTTFHFIGIPTIILAFSILPVNEPARGQTDEHGFSRDNESHENYLKRFLGLFKNPRYQFAVWGYVAYTFVMGALSVWAPIFLNRFHGMSNADATFAIGGILVVAGILGTLLGGGLASRWREKSAHSYDWTLGLSVLVATPIILVGLLSPSLPVSLACFALAMFSMFFSTGPINTVLLDAVPVTLRASAMAFSIFAIHLFGDLWSPEIVGRVSDSTQSLRSAMLILPVIMVISAFFWMLPILRTHLRKSNPSRS